MRNLNRTLALAAWALLIFCGPAQAEVFPLQSTLSGDQEVPPNNSLAIGVAQLRYDDDPTGPTLMIDVSVPAIGMVAPIGLDDLTASPFHIHPRPAGMNGPVILALGTDADWEDNPPAAGGGIVLSYMVTLTAGNYGSGGLSSGGDCTGLSFMDCLVIFETALLSDGAYLNLHTNSFPGGEIRGQIVPEPASAALGVAALGTLAALARRRHGRARR
jgi:MYXO-CTERM domain-containing protein